LFLLSPDLCPVHQYALYHALKRHHSPPEITSTLSLSYSPHTFHYHVCLPHYLSHVCLARGSFVEGVAQAVELILFTLPLSLVEHTPAFFLLHILSQAPHHFFHYSLSLFATITKIFLSLPTILLPLRLLSLTFGLYLPHTYIVDNPRGLSRQSCLTPFVVPNHSPSCSPTFTLFLPYQPFAYSSLSLSHYLKHFLSVYLVKRSPKFYKQTYILPPFFFNSVLVKWSRMYTLCIVPLPILNLAWLSGTLLVPRSLSSSFRSGLTLTTYTLRSGVLFLGSFPLCFSRPF
jgi:hypothetical protein